VYANADHFRAEVTAARRRALGPTTLLVLDSMGMSDIDYTGTRALGKVLDELDKAGVHVAVARAGAHLKEGLERSGLSSRLGADGYFPSVDEAVNAHGFGIHAT